MNKDVSQANTVHSHMPSGSNQPWVSYWPRAWGTLRKAASLGNLGGKHHSILQAGWYQRLTGLEKIMEGYLKLNYVGIWYMIFKIFYLFIHTSRRYLSSSGRYSSIFTDTSSTLPTCPGLSESSLHPRKTLGPWPTGMLGYLIYSFMNVTLICCIDDTVSSCFALDIRK